MSDIQSKIEQTPAADFSQGREGARVQAVVIHVADSPDDGVAGAMETVNWFRNPASQVSAHFVVGGGRVFQCVPTSGWAWANGIVETGWNHSIGWLKDAINKGQNPNWFTVSIECSGKPFAGTPAYLDPVDHQNLVELVAWLCDYFNLTPSRQTIIGHRDISPLSRANCPGPKFDFDGFVAEVTRTMQPPTPLPVLPQVGQPAYIEGFTVTGPAEWTSASTGKKIENRLLELYQGIDGLRYLGHPLSDNWTMYAGLWVFVFEKAVVVYDGSDAPWASCFSFGSMAVEWARERNLIA